MKATSHPTTSRRRLHAAPAIEPNTPKSAGADPIEPRWAWHHRALTRLRNRLLSSHHDHAAEVATAPEMTGIESADGARDELDRDLLWAELGAENDRLFEIDAALNRIREGTYGICEDTGQPITADRLRAIPWTRYCLSAAAAAEKRRPMI